jgi:hypothetical protein
MMTGHRIPVPPRPVPPGYGPPPYQPFPPSRTQFYNQPPLPAPPAPAPRQWKCAKSCVFNYPYVFVLVTMNL